MTSGRIKGLWRRMRHAMLAQGIPITQGARSTPGPASRRSPGKRRARVVLTRTRRNSPPVTEQAVMGTSLASTDDTGWTIETVELA